LIGTCKLNDVDPHAYLNETITPIVNGHLNSRLNEHMPWACAANSKLKAVA
jgi:transposase